MTVKNLGCNKINCTTNIYLNPSPVLGEGQGVRVNNLHLLPFGPPAWERRKEIISDIMASRCRPAPPWDFRGMLYLVPNERMVKPLRALFLESLIENTGASGCIPPNFIALNRLIRSRINGKTVPTLVKKLLLEEICQGLAGKYSGLEDEAIARSLAGPVADALERIYLHGQDCVKDENSHILSHVKKEYERRLRQMDLSDQARLLTGWEPKADDFSEYETVVLDGFYDALPHELRVMKTLMRGRGFHFILEAPGLDSELSGDGMPYAGTGKLIKELFSDAEIKQDDKQAEEDAGLVAGAVFLGRPISETVKLLKTERGPCRDLKIISALTEEDEVVFIGRTIKNLAITNSIRFDKTLVIFSEPEKYSGALKEIFTDYGIPYSFREKRPLINEPPVQAILDLLSIPAEDYSFRLMRRAFLSQARDKAADFEICARENGITGGRSRWEKLIGAKEVPFSDELANLLELLRPLSAHALNPARWAELASELLRQSGMDAPALEPVNETLLELGRDLKNLPAKLNLGRFVGILKDALSTVQAEPKKDTFKGVRVLDRLEAFSEGFETVFLAGLTEGSIPASPRREIFFNEQNMEGRTRDARLFFGLILGCNHVYLSYPKEISGHPASPSPWLTALKPFVIAGRAEEIKDFRRPDSPEAAMGKNELTRALAINGCSREQVKEVQANFAASDKRKFSVTELEDYIKCPYRYYHRWVVKDLPPEEPSDDAAPYAAGRAAHSILAKFYAGRNGKPVRQDEMDNALNKISKLADIEFSGFPDTLENRDAKRKFIEKFAPRVFEADAGLPSDTIIKDVEKAVEGELEIDGNEKVVVTGKIDRLELSEGGSFAVVDYKTGRYPGKEISFDKSFQLPLYAYLLRKYLPERRPSAFVYYNLGKTGKTRDIVCYDSSLIREKVIARKERKRDDKDAMDAYIEEVAQKASAAAQGIIGGQFPKCTDKKECMYCEVSDACTEDEDAN